MEKNRFLKILCYGTYVVGFQTMVIMDLWGMAFHAMVVIGLIPALLFISIWACCELPCHRLVRLFQFHGMNCKTDQIWPNFTHSVFTSFSIASNSLQLSFLFHVAVPLVEVPTMVAYKYAKDTQLCY